jgi:hypothetical protein
MIGRLEPAIAIRNAAPGLLALTRPGGLDVRVVPLAPRCADSKSLAFAADKILVDAPLTRDGDPELVHIANSAY